MKIYTKAGDSGLTSLIGGRKVSKANIQIDAYGTIDELNAYMGLVRDVIIDEEVKHLICDVQSRLFDIGAYLAIDIESKNKRSISLIEDDITILEKEIDRMDLELAPLKNFILPTGHRFISFMHIARCVCRRAERNVVQLHEVQPLEEIVIRYLNRLSDYLFTLTRITHKDMGIQEILWNSK